MTLTEYIGSGRGNATCLATALGICTSYLSQLASGYRPISAARATQIEALTGGLVTRRDLRPNDWAQIWPELAEREAA